MYHLTCQVSDRGTGEVHFYTEKIRIKKQVYCQVSFHIQGACLGVVVHNNKRSKREKKKHVLEKS